ncbi:MAG TPA: hypothetical protein VGJ26_18445 [Pirellulales bacterium]
MAFALGKWISLLALVAYGIAGGECFLPGARTPAVWVSRARRQKRTSPPRSDNFRFWISR